VFCVVSLGEEN